MTGSAAKRHLRLGLQLGRHVEGIVDAYFGPPELAAAVDADPPVDPQVLVTAAEALLDEVEDGWLRDQVRGLRAYAGVLAGESVSYANEVEGCYGLRPVYTDEAVFAAAHERLGELLPGAGPLAGRYERWEDSIRVPTEQVERTLASVIEAARAWTHRLVELPAGEGVVLEVVRDEPWMAFCRYLGDLRSRISVNVDLPLSAIELLILAIHETYPGHHAERCSKEHLLVRGRGLLEGRGAHVSRALGSDDPAARRAHDPLPRRADLADVRDHLPCRTRALPRVRRGRAGALHHLLTEQVRVQDLLEPREAGTPDLRKGIDSPPSRDRGGTHVR